MQLKPELRATYAQSLPKRRLFVASFDTSCHAQALSESVHSLP